MIHQADLPDTIPLFPLPGALLLPRARLPLHIFEPRYLAMMDDVLKTSTRLIGMIQPVEKGDKPRLQKIGCAGRLTAFSETDDGRYMITLTGVSRFRLVQEHAAFAPYRKAEADWTPFQQDFGATESDPDLNRPAFLDLLRRYFDVEELKTDWDSLKDADDELLINSLSMLCPFAPEEKQALLESPGLKSRRETLVTLMEIAVRGGSAEEMMQ